MRQYQVKNLAVGTQKGGRYLMDYSRKYQNPYDVFDKAGEHVKELRKNRKKEIK